MSLVYQAEEEDLLKTLWEKERMFSVYYFLCFSTMFSILQDNMTVKLTFSQRNHGFYVSAVEVF